MGKTKQNKTKQQVCVLNLSSSSQCARWRHRDTAWHPFTRSENLNHRNELQASALASIICTATDNPDSAEQQRKAFPKVKRIVMCNDLGNGGLKMIDLKQKWMSFLLHRVVRLGRAENWGKMGMDSQNITCYMFRGSRYECFYSNVDISKCKILHVLGVQVWMFFLFFYPNVDISKCKTLPKGKPNVNKCLKVWMKWSHIFGRWCWKCGLTIIMLIVQIPAVPCKTTET